MFELKRISLEAVPLALDKAERYRLLNEPDLAESICLDVLAVDPDNQRALVILLLALTDQFPTGRAECFNEAQAVVPRLRGEYERLYYSGIIWERHGNVRANQGGPGSGPVAYGWVRRAMDYYAQAEPLRPPGNDDALLRWNTCVRLCQHFRLGPEPEETDRPLLGE
jgi:hypothetical protein